MSPGFGAFIKRQTATIIVTDVQEALESVQCHFLSKFVVWFTSWSTMAERSDVVPLPVGSLPEEGVPGLQHAWPHTAHL
eukprot:2397279-Pyramimonas_sp.AAC.1